MGHFGAQLCLLHVTQPVTPVHGISVFADSVAFDAASYEKAVQEGAQRELNELIERHHLNGVQIAALVRHGNPADEIVSAAQQEGADLIVIATHGVTGWRHSLFGSVAEKVLRLVHCPVLVTRVEKPKEA